MSPLKLGNTAPMRTFNASVSHFMPGNSMRSTKTLRKDQQTVSMRDMLDQEHAATIESKLMAVEKRMDLCQSKKKAKLKEASETLRLSQ